MRLSDEQIAENMAKVQKMVAAWPDGPRKKLVAKMLAGPVGEEFFTAPASSREEYHSCYPGGLCDHSLKVVENLKAVEAAFCSNLPQARRVPHHVLEFIGLFHDLGKTGDGVNPCYLPNPEEWGKKKGILYITNKACTYMPIPERSLYILQRHGIELTSDEYLAIRLHDGQYEKANISYAMKEPDLALLIHFADRWATAQEKANQ